jgi:hypothetical protein
MLPLTGYELILPQTQGDTGACPGLWEIAPIWLELVPFTTDPNALSAILRPWRSIVVYGTSALPALQVAERQK